MAGMEVTHKQDLEEAQKANQLAVKALSEHMERQKQQEIEQLLLHHKKDIGEYTSNTHLTLLV